LEKDSHVDRGILVKQKVVIMDGKIVGFVVDFKRCFQSAEVAELSKTQVKREGRMEEYESRAHKICLIKRGQIHGVTQRDTHILYSNISYRPH
jgi:hypothetical protein